MIDVFHEAGVALSCSAELVELRVRMDRDSVEERFLLERNELFRERSDEGFIRMLNFVEDFLELLGRYPREVVDVLSEGRKDE